MKKTKYHFDQKSLTFEETKISFKQIVKKVVMFLLTAFALAVVSVFTIFYLIDSPKEKILIRENNALKDEMLAMQEKIDMIQNVVNDLQDRDDHIYRTIFESKPYPGDQRSAPENDYRHLAFNDKKSKEILTQTHQKLDRLVVSTAAQSRSFDEVLKMAAQKEEMMLRIPAIKPLKNGNLVSGFGYRFHPILKILRPHTGVDIIAPKGTPVFATADGTVIEDKNFGGGGYGVNVVIDHGYSYKTLYAHLNKKVVRHGQKVKRGEILGYVGSTGLSQAPHLHYEVIKNGVKINPVHYFFNDITPQEYEEILEASKKVNQSLS